MGVKGGDEDRGSACTDIDTGKLLIKHAGQGFAPYEAQSRKTGQTSTRVAGESDQTDNVSAAASG